jgi:class 3 adenylate cyclase/pimeloyl-ACP methyl ester carboxylesterase
VQPPETRYLRRPDSVSVAYQVFGEGPTDLLIASGFISHLDLLWPDPGFNRFLERLGSFARVIVYDKPGTGLSDPVPYVPTLEERVEDMRLLLDEVGSEHAVLMGISEGGPQTLLFAATYPERMTSLVIYGSFPKGTVAMEDLEALPEEFRIEPSRIEEMQRRMDEVLDNWGRGLAIDIFAPSAANPLQRRFYGTFERAAASPAMARALVEAARKVDVSEIMRTISVPTLVLHRVGDFIPVEGGRYIASEIPGANLVELSGDDHAWWFGDFDAIVEEIERFVTGAPAVKSSRRLMTVLFSDIVRSTERAAELGDRRWRELLERHDAVINEHVGTLGGRVVKSLGDGCLATFDGPARAILAGRAIREAVGDLDLELRMGVHTGECEVMGDDIGGIGVHIGARVGALAGPGEILVSSTVADLVVGSDLCFEERGSHALKGVPGEWRVLAVSENGGSPITPADLPGPAETMKRWDRWAVKLSQRAPRLMGFAARAGRPRNAAPAERISPSHSN